MLTIELPYPPSINRYWRRVGTKTLISREGRQFRKQVLAIITALRIQPLFGDLAVEIEVYPPDRRKRDIDNVQKAILDALEHAGVYWDDCQVVELYTRKCDVEAPAGKVLVKLRHIKEPHDGCDSRVSGMGCDQ